MVWVGYHRAGRANAWIEASVVWSTKPSHVDTESVLGSRHKAHSVLVPALGARQLQCVIVGDGRLILGFGLTPRPTAPIIGGPSDAVGVDQPEPERRRHHQPNRQNHRRENHIEHACSVSRQLETSRDQLRIT